ncbi:HNH endonuclease signature motif containing protein [Leptospira bourretii]|uniref:HNH endonuclease signature motif containing protein n=1 Tax=Leptospira bourretii TaxID=2484962 RepID=UPI001ABEF3A3|nr:HNH endonuclease signature motif containing protein [Leptospira bourretii]
MSWTDEEIQKVWEKGQKVTDNDPNLWRKDECNAWMSRKEYGNRKSDFGWEIDHISPGGSDSLSNLRPLQWDNNNDKSDGRLKCNIVSSGTNNVNKNKK